MRGDFISSLFLYARKEEFLILNQFLLNVDLKRHYCSETPTFRRGDNVELLFAFYDDGDEYSINSATKAEVYQKTTNGNIIVADCKFVNYQGKRVVSWEVEDVSMVELGYLNLKVVVYEGSKPISIQPFNILILDDYMGGAGSFIELIQELQKMIENMAIDLNYAIKIPEKGIPNGVASLDKDGKIPLLQMPQEFQGFIDHITQTVFKHRVHGFGIDEDGMGIYQDDNGDWQYIGFSPDGKGNGATQLVEATINVVNGKATVTYEGVPTVVSNKWFTGDRDTSYFLLNGTTFTGTSFNVSALGTHTLYYKDSNGTEYVKTFNVTADMFDKPKVNIEVDDGYVTVTIPSTTNATTKKWAKGARDVAYFKYNGTTFTGNTFQVEEVGTYTIYIKTSAGLEYVYVFEVTEAMLPAPIIDSTPPKLNVYYTGDYLNVKVGAVIASINTTDEVGGSGISYVTMPDGTKDYGNIAWREFIIKSNGNKTFKSTDVAGNVSTVTKSINNIGTAVKISTLPLGSKFSFCNGNYVLIEKNASGCLIAQAEANNFGAHGVEFDYSGSTNLFPEANIKHRLNSTTITGSLNEHNEILSNGKWNYGKVVNNDGTWTHSTNVYAESKAGLLTVPQLVNAYEKKWFTQTDTRELTITPYVNNVNPSDNGSISTVERSSTYGNIDVSANSITFKSNYRIAYQVSNNAIGYR